MTLAELRKTLEACQLGGTAPDAKITIRIYGHVKSFELIEISPLDDGQVELMVSKPIQHKELI